MFQGVSIVPAGAHLTLLQEQLNRVRATGDAETAHQLRVTSGRLRVWLSLGGWRVLRDDVRWLRRQVAEVRDLDVQLYQEPPPDRTVQLRQRRHAAFTELTAVLESERVNALLTALALLPPTPANVALRGVARLARGALALGTHRGWRRGDREQLHELRRAIRRVRYALEWLDVAPASLEQMQKTLGHACDRFVALEGASELADAEARAHSDRLTRELHRHVARSREHWDEVRPKLEEIAHAALRYSTR
jgi:CHAD domain-containing protein